MPLIRSGLCALGLVVLLGACSVPPSAGGVVPDPYEAQNRRVHAFNRGLDRALFRPAASGYGTILPAPVREGVANFSDNVSTPGYVVNDLLQGRAEDAGHNFFRFAINSTLGVAGIFDPATSIGLERREADFGQTLYVWGAGSGAYLELPVYGPSTQRDALGAVVDIGLSPMRVLTPPQTDAAVAAAYVGTGLGERYTLRETIDQILYESVDSYVQTRDIYIQNRRFELGDETEDYFDPYADIFE